MLLPFEHDSAVHVLEAAWVFGVPRNGARAAPVAFNLEPPVSLPVLAMEVEYSGPRTADIRCAVYWY